MQIYEHLCKCLHKLPSHFLTLRSRHTNDLVNRKSVQIFARQTAGRVGAASSATGFRSYLISQPMNPHPATAPHMPVRLNKKPLWGSSLVSGGRVSAITSEPPRWPASPISFFLPGNFFKLYPEQREPAGGRLIPFIICLLSLVLR